MLKQYSSIAAGGLGVSGGRALAGPLHAEVGITDPCNHKCIMCPNHLPEERQSAATTERFWSQPMGVMSLATFQGIVDDLQALGTSRIDLVGRGEPLLNPAVIEMVSYAKKSNLHVILCTNASKLSNRHAEGLVACGLDRLNVSLNAGTPENYPNIHVTETPENFVRVKQNLKRLAEHRATAGRTVPQVRLSSIISSKNYFEIGEMISVAADVGAEETLFTHVLVHAGTRDLALSPKQYDELKAAVPLAQRKAAALGIQTNLAVFAATPPMYLTEAVTGPLVVPCYVGWYFTLVLGNGSVLPCCQCNEPIDRVSEERTFVEIWTSGQYAEFRKAARRLPNENERLRSCECDQCFLRPRNIAIHNLLHPWDRIEGGYGEGSFRLADLLRMRRKGSSVKIGPS